jgi:transcriptional regulator with XRE-family HTH domain
MNDIHDRLREIRKFFNLSIREFSKEISYSHGVYGQIEHGDRELSDRICQLIVSKFNINKEWLLTGNGKMFLNADSVDLRLNKIIEVYNLVNPTLKEALLDCSRILLKIHKDDKKQDTPDF